MRYGFVVRGVVVSASLLALLLCFTVPAAKGADAASLFKQKCASCHGASGKGDGAAGKFLKPPPPDFTSADFAKRATAESIKEIITKGGKAVGRSPSMPAFGTLGEDKIDGLVKLILGFSGK